MFRRAEKPADPVVITFEGRPVEAERGETVAAALLAAGVRAFRVSAEDGGPRAPLCMIGNCFDCMVWIEGLGGRQACREYVREGMVIRRHPGLPEAEDGS